MPSRRRILLAAGAAFAAGCSGSEPPDRERTVTPVDVPRSADDVLREATEVSVPAVHGGVTVSEAHQERVIERCEALLEAARTELEAAENVELADVPTELRSRSEPFAAAETYLTELRETPSRDTYRRIDRRFRDLGTILGYVRATAGDLDAGALATRLGTEREAYETLIERLEYRLARPVAGLLPTVAAGEAALEHAGNRLELAERAVDEAATDDAPDSTAIAAAWGAIEQFAIASENAGGFLATGTEPGAPTRTDAIEQEIEAVREDIEYPDLPERAESDSNPDTRRMRTILSSVLSRRGDVLTRAPEELPEAERVGPLLRAYRVRNEVGAFAEAATLTLERLDDGSFPVETVPREKRRAVEAIDELAAATPLQRRLGRLAAEMVAYGDRLGNVAEGTNALTGTHFVYVGAQRFVERALSDGTALAEALGDPD